MQDNVSVLIATIVMVVIIVLFPIYNVATRQDSIASNIAIKATTNFVDKVRYQGYISEDEYQKYLEELDKTGNMYDVEMEVYKPVYIENPDPNIVEYEEEYNIDYTNTVIEKLKTGTEPESAESVIGKKVYYLNEGYKFYVRVKNTNVTQAQVLMENLFGASTEERIVVNYGGKVYKNEWAKSETAQTANANISISRPCDHSDKEFKYETITSIFNANPGEDPNIYGIAVRLEDPVNNVIKFTLSYQDVMLKQGDADFNGNAARKDEREAHVKSYIKTFGFSSANIEVNEEIKTAGANGLYSYKYEIIFKDITRDDEDAPFSLSQVQIDSGSAYSIAGSIGLLRTEEFVIFYNHYSLNNVNITFVTKTCGYEFSTKSSLKAPFTMEPKSDPSMSPLTFYRRYLDKSRDMFSYYTLNGYNGYDKYNLNYYYTIMKIEIGDIASSDMEDKIEEIRWAKGELGKDSFKNDSNFGTDIKDSWDGSYFYTSAWAPNMIFGKGKYTVYIKYKSDSGASLDEVVTGEYEPATDIMEQPLDIYIDARYRWYTKEYSYRNKVATTNGNPNLKYTFENTKNVYFTGKTQNTIVTTTHGNFVSSTAYYYFSLSDTHNLADYINQGTKSGYISWDFKDEYDTTEMTFNANSIIVSIYSDKNLVYYHAIPIFTTKKGLNDNKGTYRLFDYDTDTGIIYLAHQFE